MASGRVLWLGIDGHWSAMQFARLMHLVVRFYRLEELVELKRSGGPDLFADRLDPIALKHLAAFDWVAASLMSARFNESYARSEDLVSELGLSDPHIAGIAYGAPGQAPGHSSGHSSGHMAFAGNPAVIKTMHATFSEVVSTPEPDAGRGEDAQGRLSALEALYRRILAEKAELMDATGYAEAELHAIVSPSLEDLQFLSNAAVQGRIVGVERHNAG